MDNIIIVWNDFYSMSSFIHNHKNMGQIYGFLSIEAYRDAKALYLSHKNYVLTCWKFFRCASPYPTASAACKSLLACRSCTKSKYKSLALLATELA